MSFVFVSHASPDKLTRVRPLVHALALEGVRFWLDRPGGGEHDFRFEENFLREHGVQRLISGEPWTEGILTALRESSAVLVCLSKAAVEPGRTVLRQEVFFAVQARKAASCVVDDLDIAGVSNDWGLVQPRELQSPRIDVATLKKALDWLEANPDEPATALPRKFRRTWQMVCELRDDLDAAARRARGAGLVQVGKPSPRVISLQALVKRASPAQLQRLYYRSLPDVARELPGVSLADLLRDLDDARPRAPMWPSPLIEFAERLAREQDDIALRQWVDAQVATDLGALAALRQALDNEHLHATGRATLYVDVNAESNGERQIRWWVHAPEPALCMGEVFVPLGDRPVESVLAACLSQALTATDKRLGHRFRVRVALLLPRALLTRGIEMLPISFDDGDDLGEVSRPLYRRHPITLHWRTRALAQEEIAGRAVKAWNRALASLQSRLQIGGGANVVWLEGGSGALPAAAARLLQPTENAVCLGLGSQPVAEDDVVACLREGVPCFFWFSAPSVDAAALRLAVCDEFARVTPSEAPNRAGELRMSSQDGDPFASLTLVWDDGPPPAPNPFASPVEHPVS